MHDGFLCTLLPVFMLFLLLFESVQAEDDAAPPGMSKMPPEAQQQIDREAQAEEALLAKLNQEFSKMHAELATKLKHSYDDAIHRGDLDGAEALKAEIARLSIKAGAAPVSIIIEAYIDGDSNLVIIPDQGLQWNEAGTTAFRPGLHDNQNAPTYINDQKWSPAWSDGAQAGPGNSDIFPADIPATGTWAVEVVSISDSRGASGIMDRDPVTIRKFGLNTVVSIPDSQGGACWYKLKLTYSP